MPAPTIRHAEASDAPAIVALIDQHVATGALLPRTREFVADRADDFLVAELGDRVVGCVHLSEYSPSLAEIRSLAVDVARQAGAIDAELLAAAERLATRRQYATIFAVTNDLALFEGRGYQPSAVPELYPERDEVGRFAGVVAKEL
jgi:amino-acid N-acetyltransferase